MGLFGKTYEVTGEHADIINKYLPKQMRKPPYNNNSIEYLKKYVEDFIIKLKEQKKEKGKSLVIAKEYNLPFIVKIINTQLSCKECFGLVDIGIVERFTSKTSGNSYESGPMQATIEMTFEETWAKSNSQYTVVEKAKKMLIEKTLKTYPKTTVIQNFKIEFRELGGSGNVFIYVYGTACNSEEFNPINYSEIVSNINNELDEIDNLIKNAIKMKNDLPSKKHILNEIKIYEEAKG